MSGKLLITGATGFLGGALVSKLISAARWDDVLLLVRAGSNEEGLGRVIASIKRFDVPVGLLERLKPEQIICGDFLRTDYIADDKRLDDVTDVVNCSAITSFGKQPLIREVNVEGTHAFAEIMMRKANLRRFVHIGTAMCCGINVPSPVVERDNPVDQAIHLVDYTESKLESERLLRAIPGLPLIVLRPSIIVGHSTLGCKPSSSIYWVFRAGLALEHFMCDFDTMIDVVPVDYCAEVILKVLEAKSLKHTMYHLSAGTEFSSTFRQIDKAVAKALGRAPMEHYRKVDYKVMQELSSQFSSILGPCNRKVMLRAIKTYGAFAALGFLFMNDRLKAEGFPMPPRFTDYAGLCALTSRDQTIAEQMQTDFK